MQQTIRGVIAATLIVVAVGSASAQSTNKGPSEVNVVNTPSVTVALPARPFFDSVVGAGYRSMGPGATGTLAVSAITFTNTSGDAKQVFVFRPVLAAGTTCGTANVLGGAGPRFYVNVPAAATVHLTYPTPLVYSAFSGQACIAFSGGDNLDISVNGVVH